MGSHSFYYGLYLGFGNHYSVVYWIAIVMPGPFVLEEKKGETELESLNP